MCKGDTYVIGLFGSYMKYFQLSTDEKETLLVFSVPDFDDFDIHYT